MSLSQRICLRTVIICCAATACASPQQRKVPNSAGPPKIQDHFVLRPEFATKKGVLIAGTAFAIEIEGQERLLIMTAVHLFGPSGGLSKQIPSSELPAYISGVTLYDAFTEAELAKAGPMIDLPDASPWNQKDTGDVAAFWAQKDSNIGRAKLAQSPPKAGDAIWLAASLIDGPERDQPLHRAIVRLSKKEGINFEYENPKLNLTATSGAPLLDSEGNVIGINVSVIDLGDKIFGTATPVGLIRTLLDKALFRPKNR